MKCIQYEQKSSIMYLKNINNINISHNQHFLFTLNLNFLTANDNHSGEVASQNNEGKFDHA